MHTTLQRKFTKEIENQVIFVPFGSMLISP